MSAKVTVNSANLDRKLAKFAVLGNKGIEEAVREGARRFVGNAIRNTMPMMLTKSPASAKAEWTSRLTQNFTTHRVTKKGWLNDAELRKLLAAKKRRLGREAAGWMAAAQELKAPRVPAWVKRHGSTEGRCCIRHKGSFISISVTNSVPYNEEMTLRRAAFALNKTERGFDANLRSLKTKLLRSAR